jgi:polyisoprenoid-binding protein YceI
VPSHCRAAIALAVLAILPAPRAARALNVAGRCSVTFFASATLHDFEGKAPCALLQIEPDASGAYRARAEVAVEQLDTGISARNEKMRAMFEAQKFPRIAAQFDNVDPEALRAKRAGALPFQITIHGVERAVSPELSDWSEVPGQLAHFRATFELSLAEFGLEPPVALGIVRVGDRVRVVVDVDLEARGPAN